MTYHVFVLLGALRPADCSIYRDRYVFDLFGALRPTGDCIYMYSGS